VDLQNNLPVDLHCFFDLSIRTEKKKSGTTEKKILLVYTDFFFQFEMNAEMEISKNSGDQQGDWLVTYGPISPN